MDEEPIQTIRETSRNLLVLNRRKNRDEEADGRRCLTNVRVNPDTVSNIANKLKTRYSISLSELHTLKNAIIDDVTNIKIVLSVNGSLKGLVRELIGRQVNKQCAAVGCFCNLALGDSRAGVSIAKAAGPYLVTALDNLTSELAVTSAWTLGNLAGAGPKICQMLIAQGAVAKLIEQLDCANEEMRDAVLYALIHFLYQVTDDLRLEHLQKIFQIIPRLDVSKTTQFLFVLSCQKEFSSNLLTEAFVLKILQHLILCMKQFDNENVTYLFRFLANLYSAEVYYGVLSFLLENNMVVPVRTFSETNESVAWFLGNAFNLCSNHAFFEMFS